MILYPSSFKHNDCTYSCICIILSFFQLQVFHACTFQGNLLSSTLILGLFSAATMSFLWGWPLTATHFDDRNVDNANDNARGCNETANTVEVWISGNATGKYPHLRAEKPRFLLMYNVIPAERSIFSSSQLDSCFTRESDKIRKFRIPLASTVSIF